MAKRRCLWIHQGNEYLVAEIAGSRSTLARPRRKLTRFAAQQVIGSVVGVPAEVVGGIKGQERLRRAAIRGIALDREDAENLEVERAHPVGDDMLLTSRSDRLTRSLRRGNRLIAGVQNSARWSGPNPRPGLVRCGRAAG